MYAVSKEKTIKVDCPYCDELHSYKLKVEETIIVRGAGIEFGEGKAKTRPTFTRLFLCPKTNQEFEADFELWKDPTQRILSVTVKELVDE